MKQPERKISTWYMLISTLVCATILTACKKEAADMYGDYFPRTLNTTWYYLNTYYSSYEGIPWGADTITYQINKDTILEGRQYALLTDSQHFLKRGIRKEKGNYFYRSFQYFDTEKEYLFLKDDQPVGSRWEELSSNGYLKHVYTIEAKPASKTILGKVYSQVIEVNEAVHLKENEHFKLHYQIKHLYARNVGEIYTYYPYPSFKTYGDQKVEILNRE